VTFHKRNKGYVEHELRGLQVYTLLLRMYS